MELIFVHHAMRKIDKKPTQNDGITKLGIKDAKVVAILLKFYKQNNNICAIYSSPYLRCAKTAEILNKKLNLPIYYEEGLNEFKGVKNESWLEFQNRVRQAIKDIVLKHNEEDKVVCVTSGANIIAFIQLAMNLKPAEKTPIIKVPACSPIIFEINKNMFN